MFGCVKFAKDADSDKYVYNSYGIGFHPRLEFSLPDSGLGKNVIIYGVDMNS